MYRVKGLGQLSQRNKWDTCEDEQRTEQKIWGIPC